MILLSWLDEICDEFQLQRETWHIAVNNLDRFLSCVPKIARSKLQLVGIAALLLACKVEEYTWPSVNIMEQLADGACTRDQIVSMETFMLQKIGWLLLPVTPFIFLRLYLLMFLKAKNQNQNQNQNASSQTIPESNSNSPNALSNNNNATTTTTTTTTTATKTDEDRKEANNTNNDEAIELYFPKKEFMQMMHIIDIAVMDFKSLTYAPSLIAACVLHMVYIPQESVIIHLTNYSAEQMQECATWLRPFMKVPLPRSFFQPIELLPTNFHFLQVSNPAVKEFLESFLLTDNC